MQQISPPPVPGLACLSPVQFPTQAAERQGHGADKLNTLEDELNRFILEQRIEHTLEELRKKKAASSS
jgi:hypothetical protein